VTTSQHKTLAPPPPYRNAVIVIAIAIGMAAIFATSYSLVLGRATPHRITIGLVGSPAEQPALLAALKRATHGLRSTRTPLMPPPKKPSTIRPSTPRSSWIRASRVC
jgi:hypothetical protein